MKTYYSVLSSFGENDARAYLFEPVKAESRPQNMYTNTRGRHFHLDWFDTLENAEKYVQEVKQGKGGK